MAFSMNIITPLLLNTIKNHYSLNWHGTHGVVHWSRVYENGIRLASQKGVNEKVVQLFSIFHDSQRINESLDENHGKRGAELAGKLRHLCPINDHDFILLTTACSLHTSARDHEDITIQACFDSDRLDLGRVGTRPDPDYLCTPMAKMPETIQHGFERSRTQGFPKQPFGLTNILGL